MKLVKRIPIILDVVCLIISTWFVYRVNDHAASGCCSLQMFARDKESTPGLCVTFLEVSTLLFEDGETAILTDGYSAGKLRFLFTKIEPNPDLIARQLQRAGVHNSLHL